MVGIGSVVLDQTLPRHALCGRWYEKTSVHANIDKTPLGTSCHIRLKCRDDEKHRGRYRDGSRRSGAAVVSVTDADTESSEDRERSSSAAPKPASAVAPGAVAAVTGLTASAATVIPKPPRPPRPRGYVSPFAQTAEPALPAVTTAMFATVPIVSFAAGTYGHHTSSAHQNRDGMQYQSKHHRQQSQHHHQQTRSNRERRPELPRQDSGESGTSFGGGVSSVRRDNGAWGINASLGACAHDMPFALAAAVADRQCLWCRAAAPVTEAVADAAAAAAEIASAARGHAGAVSASALPAPTVTAVINTGDGGDGVAPSSSGCEYCAYKRQCVDDLVSGLLSAHRAQTRRVFPHARLGSSRRCQRSGSGRARLKISPGDRAVSGHVLASPLAPETPAARQKQQRLSSTGLAGASGANSDLQQHAFDFDQLHARASHHNDDNRAMQQSSLVPDLVIGDDVDLDLSANAAVDDTTSANVSPYSISRSQSHSRSCSRGRGGINDLGDGGGGGSGGIAAPAPTPAGPLSPPAARLQRFMRTSQRNTIKLSPSAISTSDGSRNSISLSSNTTANTEQTGSLDSSGSTFMIGADVATEEHDDDDEPAVPQEAGVLLVEADVARARAAGRKRAGEAHQYALLERGAMKPLTMYTISIHQEPSFAEFSTATSRAHAAYLDLLPR